jgi:hypothetical protein
LIIIHDPGLPLLMSMADFKILASKPVPCNWAFSEVCS